MTGMAGAGEEEVVVDVAKCPFAAGGVPAEREGGGRDEEPCESKFVGAEEGAWKA